MIGLGASAGCYYGAVGARLDCPMIVPTHADVANAVGAVVGQVSMRAEGVVTSPAPGEFIAHLAGGPRRFSDAAKAIDTLTESLRAEAGDRARRAGVEAVHVTVETDEIAAEIEGQRILIEARISATAKGRPRIASA